MAYFSGQKRDCYDHFRVRRVLLIHSFMKPTFSCCDDANRIIHRLHAAASGVQIAGCVGGCAEAAHRRCRAGGEHAEDQIDEGGPGRSLTAPSSSALNELDGFVPSLAAMICRLGSPD